MAFPLFGAKNPITITIGKETNTYDKIAIPNAMVSIRGGAVQISASFRYCKQNKDESLSYAPVGEQNHTIEDIFANKYVADASQSFFKGFVEDAFSKGLEL